MKTKEFTFKSATGVCDIYGCRYTPDDDAVKAVIAINHGMAEHQARYRDFVSFLTSNGFAVYMHDMANHGKSNNDKNLTGYFGKKDGYKALVKDFDSVVKIAKTDYPDKKLVIMGHSMGSFIVRCYTAWYPNAGFDGAIYMGTGGSNPIAGVGDFVSSLIAKVTGYKKKVALLDKMTFGSYNNKFEKRTAFDWLTRDNSVVDKYINDEYCGFLFSAQGMNDLVKLNINANLDDWYARVPKNLPILVISGADDSVCDYSKGVVEIENKLKATAHKNVTAKLYNGARHEILNETNRDEVYADILLWISDNVL